MTDDEVNAMVNRVEADVLLDPDVEKEWIARELSLLRKVEQENVYAFRLHRFLRDEAAMQKSDAALIRFRSCIKYLIRRLEQLP